MLKRRIIPKILVERRLVGSTAHLVNVTTTSFADSRIAGDPVAQAKLFEAQLADELMVLRIDSWTETDDSAFISLLIRLATETFMPLAVGGGVGDIDAADRLISNGADKVVLNAGALAEPPLISEIANRFGAQSVVVSIDFRRAADGMDRVAAGPGRTELLMPVHEWVETVVQLGAGEIMLCDVERDGRGSGLNLENGHRLSAGLPVPLILSGGCGTAEHFAEGYLEAGADAVAAGTLFSRRDQTPMQVRAHVHNLGIPVRMIT